MSDEVSKLSRIPCPRCGSQTEDPPIGIRTGKCVRAILIGFWIVWIVLVPVVMLGTVSLVAMVAINLGLVMLTTLLAIGMLIGMTYRCESCNFTWTFEDVEHYYDQ